MKLYHATSTDRATKILDRGFAAARVWDHEDVVFFAAKPLNGFGDLSGRSWIVIDVPAEVLALDQYTEDERVWDSEQYDVACFALPRAAVNALPRWEEQGLL